MGRSEDNEYAIAQWAPQPTPGNASSRGRSHSPPPIRLVEPSHQAYPAAVGDGPCDAAPTNLSLMEQGSITPADELLLKKPSRGDASNAVFITWSRPQGGGYWATPGDRMPFAKILGEAIDILNESVNRAKISVKCAIFKEPHKEGGSHLHAILESGATSQAWHLLDGVLRGKFRVASHIRVGTGRGYNHIERMLRYVLVPTANKMDLDPTPYFSPGFTVPPKIATDRAQAFATLKNRPAQNDEVFEWFKRNPGAQTFNDFQDYVDSKLDSGEIGILRLNKFLTKNAKDARQIVKLLIQRRDRVLNKDQNAMSWGDFMDIAWQDQCTCAAKNDLKAQLIWSVGFHDRNERFRGSKEVIGTFAENLYFGTFQDRKQNIFGVGAPGSGKTTVLRAFENIAPCHRVFSPVYGSCAPYSCLAEHHLVGSLQEFRCKQNINSATTLLWLEGKENLQVDVKHEGPTVLPRGGPRCVVSANYLTPCVGWQQEDIEAMYDRCEMFYWNLKIPQNARALAPKNKCKKCSAAFLASCSAKLLLHMETKFGPHALKNAAGN